MTCERLQQSVELEQAMHTHNTTGDTSHQLRKLVSKISELNLHLVYR